MVEEQASTSTCIFFILQRLMNVTNAIDRAHLNFTRIVNKANLLNGARFKKNAEKP